MEQKTEWIMPQQKRVVDAQEYIDVLRGILEEGKEVSLTITGNSMSPFMIHERDVIVLAPINSPLKKGDMAMFQRANGQYVMHRVCRVKSEACYFVGDAQDWIEGPISREQIFGRVTAVRRKNVWIRPGDFWWEFFEHVWIRMIPLRRPVMRIYGILTKAVRKRRKVRKEAVQK